MRARPPIYLLRLNAKDLTVAGSLTIAPARTLTALDQKLVTTKLLTKLRSCGFDVQRKPVRVAP